MNTPHPTMTRTLIASISAIAGFLTIQTIILHYTRWWYAGQMSTAERSCARVKAGMTMSEVHEAIRESGEPQGLWQAKDGVGLWTANGVCVISFDPATNKVKEAKYSRENSKFVGVQ